MVATEDGLRFGEHLSELPGQAPMFLCCPPSRPAGTVNRTAEGGLAYIPGMDSISSTSMELPGMFR